MIQFFLSKLKIRADSQTKLLPKNIFRSCLILLKRKRSVIIRDYVPQVEVNCQEIFFVLLLPIITTVKEILKSLEYIFVWGQVIWALITKRDY